MTKQWPPAGHSSSYATNEDMGPGSASYDLSIPSGRDTDLVTARVLRHDGPTEDDNAFRGQLYALIGAVVVSGGKVEAAMKRVLLVATSDSGRFADAEKTWSGLEKDLRKVVKSGHAMSKALETILSWGAENQVKRRRDDVVHAYWWDYAGCGVRRGRFYLDGRSAAIVGGIEGLEVLVEDANVLATFAEMLDDLVEPFWAQVRLPAGSVAMVQEASDQSETGRTSV